MQAYTLTDTTGPAALHLTEVPTPTIGPDEVLVRTKALSLNPVDFKTSYGTAVYGAIKQHSPLILGWDISGEVTQVGAGVTTFQPGDEVFGMVNFPGHGRAYAEYVAAPASHLAHKPASVRHEDAAAATLAALTAWQVLAKAGLRPGQRVLIHAAAGGVGHYAVQLAKELGAYVIATSSAAKRDFVLALGADEHVDYTQVRFEGVVAPVDLVIESIVGDNLARSLEVVKPGGSLISIIGGLTPELTERAQTIGIEAQALLVASNGQDQTAIAERLADGRLRSHVSLTLPFAQLPDALRQVEAGKTQGKVIVTL
ncbi:NADP-dependent oxidoreductase [Hymenobacter terrenus]|uniref:NADP-dependent oxidoreductase n=1 Tax=Hymenobacter terrenus TaxID=1629124 RepID=UPI0006196C04|nr:NADP-dependent oxidoreductase [Hymenobacter terrenus]